LFSISSDVSREALRNIDTLHEEPLGHRDLGEAGLHPDHTGTIDARYGTRTIAAAENSRVPPGRSARRFHIRYVVVGAAMSGYLTLE
jgi:hypothetical protein